MSCTGLWPPVATPFRSDFSVDHEAFLAHCRALLDEGATGLAMLGTTSEANSLTSAERMALLEASIAGGIAPERILPGTGACAVADAIALSRHATQAGCAGVLLLPPYFYKNVPDEGLFDYVRAVIDGVDDPRLQVYLYHFPAMAGAGWSTPLVRRLIDAFPGTIAGIKDSTGEWESARGFLEAFPELAIFPANEALLHKAIPIGAAGCISATANINAHAIATFLNTLSAGEASDDMTAAITARRVSATSFPLVPAIKAILADRYAAPGWNRVRPPLRPLSEDVRVRLLADPVWTERSPA